MSSLIKKIIGRLPKLPMFRRSQHPVLNRVLEVGSPVSDPKGEVTPPRWLNSLLGRWDIANHLPLLLALLVLVILVPAAYFLTLKPQGAEAGWFDDSWLYRKPIAITNAGSNQTNFQINLSIGTSALVNAGKMQSDCDDIRITDVNGKLLPYWIEENNPGCNAATDTNIWVKAPSLPTSGATLYIYYGNPSASSYQNGNDVFEFFDDFSGASLNTNKWTSLESPSISAGVLSLNSTSTKEGIRGLFALETQNSILGFRTSISSVTLGIARNGFSNTTDLSNNFYADDDAYVWNSSGTNDEQYCSHNEAVANNDGANTEDTSYHVYELRWSSSDTKFYKDDNLEHTASTQFTDETSYPRFEHQASGGALTNNVDWVYVRSYAATEPSAGSPGTEEESEGPVAYWAFDEGYGTTVNDSTQNNNDGTFGTGSSAPSWQSEDMCVSGKCLYFDGSDDYINAGTWNPSSDALTVSTWVKWNVFGSGKLVSKRDSWASNDMMWDLTENTASGNKLVWSQADQNSNNEIFDHLFSTGMWYHISIVHDGINPEILYVNGVNVDTNPVLTFGSKTSSKFNIGSYGNGTGSFFNGFIDDVKIYPYARTAEQIRADYASAGSAHGVSAVLGASQDQGDFLSEGLVGYWKMDANVGTTIPDYSGNDNTGTFGTGSSAPGWTSGMYGVGLSFNGGDYVSIGTSASINLNDTFSLATWFKSNDQTKDQLVVSWGENSNGKRRSIWVDTTGEMNFSGYFANVTTTEDVVDNTWRHLLVTVDSSYNTKIYVDGQLAASGTPALATFTTDGFFIGRSGLANEYTVGLVDETRIYNRVLSPKEVRDLYNWAPGPVAHWKMDEGSGDSVYDSSGSGIGGTWNGTGNHWATGKYGKAGQFNGSDDYVNSGSNSSLSISGTITLEAWIKTNSPSTNQSIVSKLKGGVALGGYDLEIDGATQKARFVLRESDNSDINNLFSTSTLSASQWYHIAATYNGSSAKVYLNGVQDNSVETSGTIGTPTDPVLIGYLNNVGRCFNGLIDDVKIYNYARTAKQIVQDMNAGHPAVGSPVGSAVAHWDFDEGYGTTVNNLGNGGIGLSGAFGTGSSAPTWTNDGKYGKALSFDGNDHVSITNSSDLEFEYTDPFSISTWVKTSSATYQFVYSKMQGTEPYRGYCMFIRDNGVVDLALVNTNSTNNALQVSNATTTSVSDGSWHHVVGVYNGNPAPTGIFIYIDGVLQNQDDYTIWQNGLSATILNSQDSLIGNRSDNLHLDGLIDEVKIYNFALTEDEVKLDYNQGKAMVLGSTSVNTGNTASSWASSQTYCIPGDSSTCAPPVGEWNFEEGTGTSAYDSSGNGNTGTLGAGNSAPNWINGKIGNALKFDGNNDYITAPISALGTGDYTIETWFKYVGDQQYVTSPIHNITGNYQFPHIRVQSSDLIWIQRNPNGSYRFNWTGDNNWHHLTWKRESGTIYAFLDGVSQTISSSGGNYDQNGYDFTGTSFYSGQFYYSGTRYFKPGSIDQVRIYNYARTPAQIAWDYNRGGPIGWWDLDECEGATVHDMSGNGNTGSISIGASGSQTTVGSCGVGNTAAAWSNGASGKYNASLNFDGTDDDIDCGNDNNLHFTSSDFTLSAWVKFNADGYIINKRRASATSAYYLIISNSGIKAGIGDGITFVSVPDNPTTLSSSTWYHLVATFDRDGNLTTYVNGKLDGTPESISSVGNLPTDYNLGIGNMLGNDYHFDGQIDDVRIYNYALTATQVKNLYNAGSAVRFGE